MRAVVARAFGGPEVLELAEVERPAPISTEVLVRVRYAGVNPVDWKTRSGRGVARSVGEPPFTPGWDVAGVVEEIGYGVTRFAPGDEVFGLPWFPRRAGTYAEYVTAPSLQLAQVPGRLSLAEAAGLPLAGLTAWQSLVDGAGIAAGQRVLITGANGGVGHVAVQVAKAQGAHVIALARARHHDFLHELGADELVDREAVPVGEAASDVDAALELVGGAEAGKALDALKPGGTLLAIPDGAGDAVKAEAERRGIRVLEPLVEPDGRALDEIAKIDALRVDLHEILPLGQAARAHELLEGGGLRGKLVLEVGG